MNATTLLTANLPQKNSTALHILCTHKQQRSKLFAAIFHVCSLRSSNSNVLLLFAGDLHACRMKKWLLFGDQHNVLLFWCITVSHCEHVCYCTWSSLMMSTWGSIGVIVAPAAVRVISWAHVFLAPSVSTTKCT